MIIDKKETDFSESAEAVRRRNFGKEPLAYVITFGCQQNEADSEIIRGMAVNMGYAITQKPEDADLIVMNTCAIREHAEMKALSTLGLYKALKKAKPELAIGVVGCMAAESGTVQRLKCDFHYVAFAIQPNMLYKLPSVLLDYLENGKRSFIIGEDKGDIVESLPTVRTDGNRAYVSVMYGCNNFCSYCIVPYVRGRERSRSSATVLNECRELAEIGVREITLLGQNVNSYRSDMDFPSLLEEIAKIDGDFIIRFMTSHPKDASLELIEVMRKYKGKIAPFFHLPLQSGSNTILRSMNRTYDRERYLSVVSALREAIPDIVLSTDVIIGFPGETDEDFAATMDILKRVRFDNVYSFLYSPREGTRAAKMTNTVPEEVKNARMKELLSVQDEIALERNLLYVGKTERVLVESVSKKGSAFTSRTAGGKLVHFTSDKCEIGDLINVKITRAGAYELFAEEIN